jgi:hypothetical protein
MFQTSSAANIECLLLEFVAIGESGRSVKIHSVGLSHRKMVDILRKGANTVAHVIIKLFARTMVLVAAASMRISVGSTQRVAKQAVTG